VSSSLRRGTLAASVLAACALTLTACGAGNNAATLQVQADSAATQVKDIKVQAVNIITTDGGDGPIGISARVFNDARTPETLEAIRIKGVDGRIKLSPPPGGKTLEVPAEGHLALGGKGHASALVPDSGTVSPGEMQRITFVLSRTGKVTLRAAVVPADQDGYANYGPSSRPTPSGLPTGNPSPRPGAPTGEPTGTPTGTPAPGETTDPAAGESPATGAGDAHAGH
jgi:hypothetical protein